MKNDSQIQNILETLFFLFLIFWALKIIIFIFRYIIWEFICLILDKLHLKNIFKKQLLLFFDKRKNIDNSIEKIYSIRLIMAKILGVSREEFQNLYIKNEEKKDSFKNKKATIKTAFYDIFFIIFFPIQQFDYIQMVLDFIEKELFRYKDEIEKNFSFFKQLKILFSKKKDREKYINKNHEIKKKIDFIYTNTSILLNMFRQIEKFNSENNKKIKLEMLSVFEYSKKDRLKIWFKTYLNLYKKNIIIMILSFVLKITNFYPIIFNFIFKLI